MAKGMGHFSHHNAEMGGVLHLSSSCDLVCLWKQGVTKVASHAAYMCGAKMSQAHCHTSRAWAKPWRSWSKALEQSVGAKPRQFQALEQLLSSLCSWDWLREKAEAASASFREPRELLVGSTGWGHQAAFLCCAGLCWRKQRKRVNKDQVFKYRSCVTSPLWDYEGLKLAYVGIDTPMGLWTANKPRKWYTEITSHLVSFPRMLCRVTFSLTAYCCS